MMERKIICRLCDVLPDIDPSDAGRIKVKINGIDQVAQWCFPLLPKLIHVRPKPGETVIVFFEEDGAVYDNRYYIGPVLSQPYFYEYEGFLTTSLSALADKRCELAEPPSSVEDYKATFPTDDDVALIGRKNAELRLKENEVRVLCGKQDTPDHPDLPKRMYFNLVNPAYIQMKYFPKGKRNTLANGQDEEFGSIINIGADKINFVSRSGNTAPGKTISKPEEILSDDEMLGPNGYLDNSHPMVYGDMLVAYLKRLTMLVRTHVHPFSTQPPSFNDADKQILNENLDRMLADYIRMS